MASNPGPAAPGPAKSPAIALDSFNFARAAKLAALLLFLLPWVTVSCGQQTMASMSGYELATGTVTVHNPMTGAAQHPPGNQGPDVPVLVAFLLIVGSLLLGFVLRRGLATLVGMAGSAAAAVLISYTVWVRIPNESRATPPSGGEGSGMFNEQQIAEMIRVDVANGYWLTIGALAAAILLNWLARNRAT